MIYPTPHLCWPALVLHLTPHISSVSSQLLSLSLSPIHRCAIEKHCCRTLRFVIFCTLQINWDSSWKQWHTLMPYRFVINTVIFTEVTVTEEVLELCAGAFQQWHHVHTEPNGTTIRSTSSNRRAALILIWTLGPNVLRQGTAYLWVSLMTYIWML